ncbi:hypothetical protein ABW20_dc0101373 [Dactylellina cionopaga]|nr:hypothetical protein ABW20_dc0101373 [Dactylellina cionopaga]
MRDAFFLWDEVRVGGKNIPLTLDTLRDGLKGKLKALVRIEEDNPVQARSIFTSFGFDDSDLRIPEDNTLGWEDTPTNRVFYSLLCMLTEIAYARGTFWDFLVWADGNVGLLRWLRRTEDMNYQYVAPTLFGGTFSKNHRKFIFDSAKRKDDREVINKYIVVLDGVLRGMMYLRSKSFRMGPKLEIGAGVMVSYDDIIKTVRGWKDGVEKVRNAYSAIPPLPGLEDPDVEEDADDPAGISEIPMSRSIQNTPSHGEWPVDVETFPSNLEKSEPLLQSLPAYVDTDFDLLSPRSPCKFVEGNNAEKKKGCNIF